MALQIGDICKKGHNLIGDNVQQYMNRGRPHIRCATCNQPPRNEPKKRGDNCKHGHVIDGINYGERLVFGKMQAFCRKCQRAAVRRSQAKRSEPKNVNRKERSDLQARQRAAEKADRLIEDGKDENALKYLLLTKRAERAIEPLQKELANKKPNCDENPGPYIDYAEEDTPSIVQAYLLCKGCPVLLECARFATAYKPPVGVWGGEVYIDGKTRDK
jgi:hypothetical protein